MTRTVGQSLPRSEDDDFLRGRSTYVADLQLPELTNAAHVAFVRSPIGHGRIVGIDVDEAKQMPGVLAVIASADHDVIPVGPFLAEIHSAFTQPLLAEGRVRYPGEPVVAVVATTLAQAVDAAEFVVVDYEPLQAVTDVYDALADNTVLFDDGLARTRADSLSWQPTNVAMSGDAENRDDAKFDSADVSVALRVRNPRQAPAPIETRAMACIWEGDDHLRVWSATQVPHSFADKLSALYDLPRENVHVIAGPAVGGGFGGKTSRSPEERMLPMLARAVGKPIVWAETRSEYMAGATQSRGEHIDVTLAGTSDGRFTALRMHMLKDVGAYPGVGTRLPAPYSKPMAGGPYDIAHIEFSYDAVVTNGAQVGAFRGAGRAPVIDALERAVDIFAAEVGLDPVEVRRRNLIAPEQMPYDTPGGGRYDEANYPADLERAVRAVDYERWRSEQASRRAAGSTREIGIGLGCYLHLTGGSGGEEATVTIAADGSAVIVTGSTSQGHGHATTWAQIASDVLGIDVAAISVVEGDTAAISSGGGAVGSRSAQTAGIAVHNAAEQVVERGRDLAAQLLEAALDDIELDIGRGQFQVRGTPSRGVTWVDIAAHAITTGDPVSCGDLFDPGAGVVPSGTHIAIVEVDIDTGGTTVLEFVGVDDAGRRINPMIVEGQLHGGIAAGIGQALGEEVVYDPEGTLVTSNFADYLVAPIDWIPSLTLVASETPTSYNHLGVKAVGESGPIGATAAVHNAVLDALAARGVRHIDVPCHPERIWRALRDAAG